MGQNPAAADSRGINVNRICYICVTVGAILAGLAGASLSISSLNLFQDNLTAGQGFIAVALVYFGGWSPVGVMLGALLFSVANSFQLWMQVLGVPVPPSLANILPYILKLEDGGLQIGFNPGFDLPTDVAEAAEETIKAIASGAIVVTP